MCGMIGVFGSEADEHSLKKGIEPGLKIMEGRGREGSGIHCGKGYCIGHLMHNAAGHVKQPLVNEKEGSFFMADCEICNWKELAGRHGIKARDDSELLFMLLEMKGLDNLDKTLAELDGSYAFVYCKGNNMVLARDILGIKPLWFSHCERFAFASERKALEKAGFNAAMELNPRKILAYGLKTKKTTFIDRAFFSTQLEIDEPKEKITDDIIGLMKNAVKKRVPEGRFGLLFSGGVDSSTIALLLKGLGCDFTCYTAALDSQSMKEPEDIAYAKKAAKAMGLKLKIVRIKEADVGKCLKKIVPLIEDSNVVKAGVALTFFKACEQAKKDGCRAIFSGLGSEEIFGGYERHKKADDVNKECLSGLMKMHERDMYRDDAITMNNGLELRLPFLDKALVTYSLMIPSRYKIGGGQGKMILREAALKLGLEKETAMRKKKAAQYGSNFHKGLEKLSRKAGFRMISSYTRQFYPGRDIKLGALVSSGKDSIYAMSLMQKQSYEIACIITLRSRNPDSFMFHTPGIDMVRLQAESMGIPLIEQDTEGEKEEELKDLKIALEKAKERHHIGGIVTGALCSNYQRERIEKIAGSAGLRVFSPLWHMDQETYMRQLIDEGFEFIITKVSAEGLEKSWLNRPIRQEDVDRLAAMNILNGINVAFEGGEAETLMIDGPVFRKRIRIEESEIKEESKCIASLIIKKAKLTDNPGKSRD